MTGSPEYPNDRPDDNDRGAHILKRVTLPSGKQLDVISFIDQFVESNPVKRHGPLSNCQCCGYDRVQPTSWSKAGEEHWHVGLRCPDCEERREGIMDQDELDEFDVALDEGTRAVAADLDLISRANMADDIDRFCKALVANHIVPDDF